MLETLQIVKLALYSCRFVVLNYESMDQLYGINLFVSAAERGAFALAARDLGITPSAVSKAVARLEERLGIRLFRRTTRAIALTDDGLIFFERCRSALSDIKAAEDALLHRAERPRGLLRVSVPIAFGTRLIAPLLPEFLERYREVDLEILSSDRTSDLVEDGLDCAIRTGALQDSTLIARKLMDTRFIACAAPSYLKSHGEPTSVGDLAGHRTLRFIMPSSNRPFVWPFLVNGKPFAFTPPAHATFNNVDTMIGAAEAGAGILLKQDYMLANSLAAGRLTPVLEPFTADGGPVSIVYLPSRHLSPKLRVFVDHLVSKLSRTSGMVPVTT
ncbi:MAG: LysR family transcriptional regulator [Xanthobacteraceae bacterium]|nr:LysR family transcriptional regulator [Xanthobacteraceae bacterium]